MVDLERFCKLLDAVESGAARPEDLNELVRVGRDAANQFDGTCSRCAERSTNINPLVVDGPDNSRVCLHCFGDILTAFVETNASR